MMTQPTFLFFLVLLHHPFVYSNCNVGEGSCECVQIHSTPNNIIPVGSTSITIYGSGLRYCVANPTSCLFNFLTAGEGKESRKTGATTIQVTATKTQTAIFGFACSQNPSSCDTEISVSLDPTTLPTAFNTGPLYTYVSCSTPTMVGARLYWYIQPVAGSHSCHPERSQSCNTTYTHYPSNPAGILSGENTDPGHRSNVIGTDRAPMIGHIGSLSDVTPTRAESSGIGLITADDSIGSTSTITSTARSNSDTSSIGGDVSTSGTSTTKTSTSNAPTSDVKNDRITFTFTSNVAPTSICSSSNSTASTGCMPATCTWVDSETEVSISNEALLNSNKVICPFVVWPHRAGKVHLKLCLQSSITFNTMNQTTMLSTSIIDKNDQFCFLWNSKETQQPTSLKSVTKYNSVPFNFTETWNSISRSSMNVHGGQVTYVYGNGFDVRVHLDNRNNNIISKKFSDESKEVGYRVKFQMSRFILYVNAHPISADGLIFATPQWVESPVRLKVVVEKLIIKGSLYSTCPLNDRDDNTQCTWVPLPRKGAIQDDLPPTNNHDDFMSNTKDKNIKDIYLNIIGSCGNVNSPR
jgi:hypothetical protein